MSLISTFIEGIGTLGLVEGRLPHRVVQATGEAPSTASPMSPPDELELLEKKALEKGIAYDELDKTRRIGDCPAQVQTRIKHLHEWLAAH